MINPFELFAAIRQLYLDVSKYLYVGSMMFVFAFVLFTYHMQVNGHPEERKICWQQGGVLWHTLGGNLICIKPEPKKLSKEAIK